MGDADAARSLLSAQAVRERAHEMLAAGLRGELAHFTVDLESLGLAAHVVSELTRVSYPDGNVPFHARWRHFVLGIGAQRIGRVDGERTGLEHAQARDAKPFGTRGNLLRTGVEIFP